LTKQSAIDTSGLSEDRASSIRKAGNAVVFLDAAMRAGLIRTDLGERISATSRTPNADDLFAEVFVQARGPSL
jgi:hypothetical protein